MINNRITKKQAGLSLIEAIIVLAILATIISAIALNAKEATTEKNIQSVIQEVFQIYSSVQRVYGEEGTSGIANTQAAQLGVKPATVRGDNSNWRNSFEGQYNLDEISGGGIYDFELELTKIPTGKACTEIIRESKKANWTDIKVGSKTDSVDAWGTSEIATACNNATNSDITITFIYDVE